MEQEKTKAVAKTDKKNSQLISLDAAVDKIQVVQFVYQLLSGYESSGATLGCSRFLG